MKKSQAEWASIRRCFLEDVSRGGVKLILRDRAWAVTPDERWIALPASSDSPIAGRWWLGCDPEKLRARRPIGIILLCQQRSGPVHAIGLPASTFWDVEPRLARNERQVFFSVVRQGPRFSLQLRGGEVIDVTERVGDLSWLSGARVHAYRDASGDASTCAVVHETASAEGARNGAPHRFFAAAENGTLRPLDDIALEPGSFYLVEARQVPGVPGNTSARRILARGGPADLPPDFAEQHDHYAHGAARR
jgi:hypothetical protein